ncbi:hypothetical protein JTE90_019360 [Oedothorax gibbosus]|uniref:Uncharacterized protein n=1 Tax=Oedothorax gibbosus TaxID=931172 RepID=A0AAV6UM19_9ARAC|nr:hypothetical protein JTE90_019360 [Oedothorax gibbosus]
MLKILLNVSLCIVLLAIFIQFLLTYIWIPHGIITDPKAEYDFIIVGAGSSGCVLARRLWEKTNLSVLVIEAGTTAPWISQVPLLAPALQGQAADWALKTEPQVKSQHGFNNKKSSWPRGKVLGGSSVLNYMLHMWGAPSDYDVRWSAGDEGWGFESVKRYFRKSESLVDNEVHSGFRGKRGPMPVTVFDKTSSSLVTAFLDGISSMGIITGDLNGDLEDGTMLSQSNILNGWRISAFDAYLSSIMKIAKIHLLTNTMAVKVLLEDDRAVGVQAVDLVSGKSHLIKAKREVVLSAGVIGSPHLLMLSGIGQEKDLKQHGIIVKKNLPGVGQNLRDHLNVPLYFHVDASVSATTTKIRSIPGVWKYLTAGKGFLAHSGVEAIARFPSNADNTTQSKMFFMLFNLGSVNEELFMKISNYRNDTFVETFPDSRNDSKEGFIILASCTHPFSRGKISLSSANPMELPLIDPDYLNNPEDLTCLKKAVKMAARLGSTPPLRALGSRLHLPGYRECLEFGQSLQSERFLECWIRMSAMTAYHPVGTCSMGKHDDPMAVLDWTLRVRGMKNLRVVDSSAFPHLTSGNPHAVVLMVAEKAADLIVTDLKRHH